MSNSKIDFLYLSEQDMIKAGVNDMAGCLLSMEDMFKLLVAGDYRMGGDNGNEHGIRLSFPRTSDVPGMPLAEPDKRMMAMPAYLGGKYKLYGCKTYGSNPHNKEYGQPRSILMMSLMDSVTGAPKAYMSANILSAMRTGAVSGLGAKWLANKDAHVVSIIGPGVMSRYTLDAFMVARPNIDTVKIKGRGKENINRFIDFAKKSYPQIKNCIVCETLEETCRESDIIFYGTTNAAKYEDNPYIEESWVKQGAVVISASALLIKTEFLSKDNVKLVADNYAMYAGWGEGRELPTQKTVSTLLGMGFYDAVTEGKLSRECITEMGDVINGKAKARENESQIVVYAVGGMSLEDVAWGYECYQYALKNNIGTKLNLWDEPELMK
jgi:ornithine cyclodeaminase